MRPDITYQPHVWLTAKHEAQYNEKESYRPWVAVFVNGHRHIVINAELAAAMGDVNSQLVAAASTAMHVATRLNACTARQPAPAWYRDHIKETYSASFAGDPALQTAAPAEHEPPAHHHINSLLAAHQQRAIDALPTSELNELEQAQKQRAEDDLASGAK